MPQRPHNFVWLLLALLLSVQPLLPAAAYAEAQMRCAGMAASSRPCAHASLATSGLTAQKTYTALMACCRMTKSGCIMRQGCPAMGRPQAVCASPRLAALSPPRCVVTIHLASVSRAFLAPQRAKWLLAAAPALALPTLSLLDGFPVATRSHPAPPAVALPPRLLPCLNGLRAPPVS